MSKTIRTKDIAIEFTAKAFSDDGSGEVEGYASVFGNIDHARDVIERGAFTKTLQMNKGKVRFLWQHDRYQPIGAVTELYEDEKGLYFKATFANTPKGQEARELLKMEGAMGGFSIGFQIIQEVTDELPTGAYVNRIKEIRLLEISAVTFPCNEEAVVVGVKSDEALTEDEDALLEKFKSFLMSQRAESKEEPEVQDVPVVEEPEQEAETPPVVDEPVEPEVNKEVEALEAIKNNLELALLLDTLRAVRIN